jgi:hypothetical protein
MHLLHVDGCCKLVRFVCYAQVGTGDVPPVDVISALSHWYFFPNGNSLPEVAISNTTLSKTSPLIGLEALPRMTPGDNLQQDSNYFQKVSVLGETHSTAPPFSLGVRLRSPNGVEGVGERGRTP